MKIRRFLKLVSLHLIIFLVTSEMPRPRTLGTVLAFQVFLVDGFACFDSLLRVWHFCTAEHAQLITLPYFQKHLQYYST